MEHSNGNVGISEKVYGQILEMITSGQYKPGDKIPSENELKDMFSASRNTVRIALNRLRTLGIIDTRHGGGSYVREIGSDVYLNMLIPAILFEKNDLIDILEFSKAIEVQAVGLAAQNADENDIRQMRAASKRLKQNASDPEKLWMMNTYLHMEMVRASKNRLFVTMEELIQNILTNEMKTFLINQGEDIDSGFYHSSIIECIVRHKSEEASFLMDRHDTLVIERVREFNRKAAESGTNAAPGTGQTESV